ncbi:MAG: Xaa-Pro peptidase family protein [Phycisphaerales bacterium]
MIIGEGIDVAEFVARRERVMEGLEGAVGVVVAGAGSSVVTDSFQPDWNFYYLTGVRDEAGAAVLMDPRAEDPRRRAVLFLRPLNPEVEEWDGYRDRISTGLKQRTGFETVMRTTHLPRFLTITARRRGKLACLHPFAVYDAPVTADLAAFRKVSERTVGVSIVDKTDLVPSLRAVKSGAELAVMRKAVEATHAGFAAAAVAIRPGANERDVQRALEDAFRDAGAGGTGYGSIVGAGLNSTVLHYRANDQRIGEGDVVLIDAGARVGGYTADVTRTFPAGGRFSPEQRGVYEVVLEALKAATAAVRPGVWMHEVEMAARAVIERAGHGDAFMHGIGHQLGIEVHDAQPEGPLREGMVVTIEPGVYLAERKLGVRIEDDVLVTARGAEVLTAAIPREAAEVEAMVGDR